MPKNEHIDLLVTVGSGTLKPSYPNSVRYNAFLANQLAIVKNLLVEKVQEINQLTLTELKQLLEKTLKATDGKGKQVSKGPKLTEYYEKIIVDLNEAGRFGTAAQYKGDFCAIKRYLRELDLKDVFLKDVNTSFLEDFRDSCLKRGVKNGIVRYLKTLRAVYNKAIKDPDTPITEKDYPFKGFEIKRIVKTKKRAVKKYAIQNLRNLDLEPGSEEWHVRNYFLFIYNSRGMQLIDMAFLTTKNFIGDRFTYLRRKTKKEYSVKLTKESMEILSYYQKKVKSPDDFLFPIIPKRAWGNQKKNTLPIKAN